MEPYSGIHTEGFPDISYATSLLSLGVERIVFGVYFLHISAFLSWHLGVGFALPGEMEFILCIVLMFDSL